MQKDVSLDFLTVVSEYMSFMDNVTLIEEWSGKFKLSSRFPKLKINLKTQYIFKT